MNRGGTLLVACGIWLVVVGLFLLEIGWRPEGLGGWMIALLLGPPIYVAMELLGAGVVDGVEGIAERAKLGRTGRIVLLALIGFALVLAIAAVEHGLLEFGQ